MRRLFFAQASEQLHKLTSFTPLVRWFLLTQGVTVSALVLFVLAAWAVCAPLGLVVCGVCLIVLERKVEIDRRSTIET